MDRALNIPATDALVFNMVQETHRTSSTLREEVKRQVLAGTSTPFAKSPKDLEILKAKVRRLEKQIAQVQDVLGGMEGKRALGDLPRKVYEAKSRVVREKLEELEVELNNTQLEIKGSQTHARWVDWFKSYGDDVNRKKSLSDDDRRGYIAGLVERIDVRYIKKSDEHELAVRFLLPIVGDGIKYKDRRNRKLGYEVEQGARDLKMRIPKKAGESEGKTGAPLRNQSITVE